MMKIFSALTGFLLLGACAAPPPQPVANPQFYDSHDAGYIATPDAALALMTAGVDTAINAAKPSKKKGAAEVIHGHCVILSGDSESPCSSMLVLLKSRGGEILQQEHTDMKGDFVFNVRAEEGYSVDVKSSRFKVSFEPAAPFVADSHVLLKLQPL